MNKRRRSTLDLRVLERSDDVLWTIAPPGIVLHNIARHCYLELDETGYKAWGYLDGARSVDEVVERCAAPGDGKKVRGIVETLFANGFVEERKDA